jgi:flagellar assembly protein FliH
MTEITLKVPRKKNKLQLIQAEKVVEKLTKERQERLKKVFEFDKYERMQEYEKLKEEKELSELIENIEVEAEKVDFDLREIDEDLSGFSEEFSKNQQEKSFSIIENFDKETLLNEIINEPEIILQEPEAPITNKKTIYTEIYSISDANIPIGITYNEKKKDAINADLVGEYVQNAYDRGFADCKEVGNIEAETRVLEAHRWIKRIGKLMLELRKHYSEELTEFKEKLINLSMLVAENVINQEVAKDKNIVVNQIEKVLDELDDDAVFDIRINPEDLQYLKDIKSAVITNSKVLADTIFVPDETIKQGGCIFKISAGTIDATIDTQLKKLQNELQNISNEEKGNINPMELKQIPDVTEPIDIEEVD